MTDFFDRLYYRYYRFQERVGNRDIAPFMSSLLIVIILMLYYFAFFFLLIFFFPKERLEINMNNFKIVSVVVVVLLIAGFPTMYLYKKRYKDRLNKYSNQNTNGLIAILWHSHPPANSISGSQPTGTSDHDFANPLYAMNGATFGVGIIVSKNTATIYPVSSPVTQNTENRQDSLVTTPTYSKDFRGFQSNFQYGVFNRNLTPKTYWTQ